MKLKGRSKAKDGRVKSFCTATSGAKGFSLLELMVVSGLLAVISMATYAGIDGGVRIWKRVEASVGELDLTLGWKKIRKDLVSYIPFRSIGFHGSALGVSFPGLVSVKGEGDIIHQEVGQVRYLFDEVNNHLCREELSYSAAVRKAAGSCRPVVTSIEAIKFEYYGVDSTPGSTGSWRESWDEEYAPIAVRMKITLEKSGGNSDVTKQYTATLP